MRGCGGRGCERDVLVGCEVMLGMMDEGVSPGVVVGGGKEAGFGSCGRRVEGARGPACPSPRGAGWRVQAWGWGTSPIWC